MLVDFGPTLLISHVRGLSPFAEFPPQSYDTIVHVRLIFNNKQLTDKGERIHFFLHLGESKCMPLPLLLYEHLTYIYFGIGTNGSRTNKKPFWFCLSVEF